MRSQVRHEGSTWKTSRKCMGIRKKWYYRFIRSVRIYEVIDKIDVLGTLLTPRGCVCFFEQVTPLKFYRVDYLPSWR